MLRRWALLLMVAGAGWGCTYNKPTYTLTGEEHKRQWQAVYRSDELGLYEDLDLVFQTDQPTRLNKWHSR